MIQCGTGRGWPAIKRELSMNSKSKVRVIKKGESVIKEPVRTEEQDSGRQPARKIVNNVSNWVNDLQRRKRAETKEAIEKLFPANPQADSA